LPLFVLHEIKDKNPLVDLSLFKSLNFSIAILCIVCAYLIYSGAIVLMPQLLQSVYGYTSVWAGLAYAPIGIMPLIIAPLIGRYNKNIDMRLLVTFSFTVYFICYHWRSVTFTPTIDFTSIIWPQLIQGFAVACFFLPLTTISLAGLSYDKLASATSLSNFLRTLSGSVGTSLTMTLWSRRESVHHAQLTENINSANPVFEHYISNLKTAGLSTSQALEYINQTITQQSLLISANEIFSVSSYVFLTLTLLVWFAKPYKK